MIIHTLLIASGTTTTTTTTHHNHQPQPPTPNQPPTTNTQPTTNHQHPTTNHQPPTTTNNNNTLVLGCLALCGTVSLMLWELDELRRVSGRHELGAMSAAVLISNVLTVNVWEYGWSIRDGRMSWSAMHKRMTWLPHSLCCLTWRG